MHRPLITIGRGGSRADVRLTGAELAGGQLELRYISRGGGAILHAPGQLAIYPIVPLASHGWSVGEYMRRLHKSLAELLLEFKVRPVHLPGSMALAGRSGVLAGFKDLVRRSSTHRASSPAQWQDRIDASLVF